MCLLSDYFGDFPDWNQSVTKYNDYARKWHVCNKDINIFDNGETGFTFASAGFDMPFCSLNNLVIGCLID